MRTIEHLLTSVQADTFPTDLPTLCDYGFLACRDREEFQDLFGFYSGLIRILGIDTSLMHEHMIAGKLGGFITDFLNGKIREGFDNIPQWGYYKQAKKRGVLDAVFARNRALAIQPPKD